MSKNPKSFNTPSPTIVWDKPTRYRWIATGACSYSLLLLAACGGEPSAPAPVQVQPTALIAASSQSLSGTVGTDLQETPTVLTQDAQGRPVANVRVTFSTAINGTITTRINVTSTAAGIAKLPRWTLGNHPGENVVVASHLSLPEVTFRAMAFAGPPANVVKMEGDDQVGSPNTLVPYAPTIRVEDALGNVLAGVKVSFEVTGGGGTVMNGIALTDEFGLARAGGWKLGPGGPQAMDVRISGVAPIVFHAEVFEPLSCAKASVLQSNSERRSQLTAASCQTASGRYFDLYLVTVSGPSALQVTLASKEFTPLLELFDEGGKPVAAVESANGIGTTTLKAILPRGSYMLSVSTPVAGSKGAYAATSSLVSATSDGCERVFVARGITIWDTATTSLCDPNGVPADQFRIFIDANTSISLTLKDNSYSGPHMELLNDRGERVANGTSPAYYIETLNYTAAMSGYYVIRVLSPYDDQALYELTVR